jgi:AcrR family transcriptional regulator
VTEGTGTASVKKAARKPAAKTRSIGRPAGRRSIGKQFLIDKTIELLREVPPEKLSLSMAARHAKVHLTLFKYYFMDRTRLLVDVARALAKSLGDSLAAIETTQPAAPERLRIRVDALVDFLFLNPFYHRLMMEIIRDEEDPLASELISLWTTKTVDIYQDIINSGVAEGSLRPIDPSFAFAAISGLCEQYQHAARIARTPAGEPGQIAAEYKAFVYDLIMHGFGARTSPPTKARSRATSSTRRKHTPPSSTT